jgi:hypothetical protein
VGFLGLRPHRIAEPIPIGASRTHDVELDFARQFDDGLRVMAVLEQRVFEGLGTIEEQSSIETVLLPDNPVAAAILADKDDGGRRAARWRFDEFHFDIPLQDDGECNIVPAGYEFERVEPAIS